MTDKTDVQFFSWRDAFDTNIAILDGQHELLNRAYSAHQRAKNLGKNRYCFA
jgi:GGDEF domain-containing protein